MNRNDLLDSWKTLSDKDSIYQIKISGNINSALLAIVDNMQIQKHPEKNVINLIGGFPDQSALLGLLNALNDIRYEILSVRILETD
jgi:hypothetical protein